MSENPFLLPRGGSKPPVPPEVPDADAPADSGTSAGAEVPADSGAPAEPDAQSGAGAPARYIAVPASVESGTRRIERPAPQPEPVPESISEDTRVALVSPPRAWVLVLPDGARLRLEGPLLLGRDPAGIPERPEAALLPLADPGKTVSKTHALLDPSPDGVRVRDLHSTNGVAVDTAQGRQLVSAGSEAVAPPGSTILLGSFAIGVAA